MVSSLRGKMKKRSCRSRGGFGGSNVREEVAGGGDASEATEVDFSNVTMKGSNRRRWSERYKREAAAFSNIR